MVSNIEGSKGTAERSALSNGRRALHRWLIRAASRLRPVDPDTLLDRLRPDGAIAKTFIEAGLAKLQAGRPDAARALLERGACAYPEDLALIQAAASLARESGRFALATAYWEAAWQGAPGDARNACGLSASLRANFQPARASSIIEAALARFPDDPAVIAEAARVAAVRGRHERALHLWNDLLARDAAMLEALGGKKDALTALHDLAAMQNEGVEDTAGRDPSIPEVSITHGELMLEFESLGDNCEFGLVQRYSGIEPLGLFRFTESQAGHLDHAFSTCFEHYGTDDDLFIGHLHGDEEYLGSSLYYGGFKYHTDACGPGVDENELRKTELRKLSYLKQRMLSNLRDGEKIFVRKQGNHDAAMGLSRTIRAMGPNIFLWVQQADDDHPVGHVDVVEPGLLRGYISKFAWYGDARALELHDWLALCLNALGLAKEMRGEQVRYRLPDNTILQTGRGWNMTKRCRARYVESPKLGTQTVDELTLLEDTDRWFPIIAEQHIEAFPSAGSPVVFSVWIFVPKAFRGTFVAVYFDHAPEGYARRADLDNRDAWQRIYASTKMPKHHVQTAVGLHIAGHAGDVVYAAAWRLETGFVPTPWPIDFGPIDRM